MRAAARRRSVLDGGTPWPLRPWGRSYQGVSATPQMCVPAPASPAKIFSALLGRAYGFTRAGGPFQHPAPDGSIHAKLDCMSAAVSSEGTAPGTSESRRIAILRHAKADWPEVSDHERPLAERGRMDAPAAGRWIGSHDLSFDLAICSTAVRTRETWKLAVQEIPHRPKTVYEERLYEASLGDLIALLNETPDDVRDLLVIGHNPGMHALADALAGRGDADAQARMNRVGFPTASVAFVEFTGSWKALEHGVATLTDFWAPHE